MPGYYSRDGAPIADVTTPAAAAVLVRDALLKVPATSQGDVGTVALAATAVLHERGWLHDPDEVAALRAVADVWRRTAQAPVWRNDPDLASALADLDRALLALAAAQPSTQS